MTYIAAADFRERTQKIWTTNLHLSEGDGSDADIDAMIAIATARVELDLNDDFEPAGGDPDETIDITGSGTLTLYLPRRVRAITTLQTKDNYGNFTTQASTSYALRKSLNAAGTAMVEGRILDYLEAYTITTGVWPCIGNGVRIVGKFGWAAVPDDIKRLVALGTYELIKATSDPLSVVTQMNTIDAVRTFGPSPEIQGIVDRYKREPVMVA